MVHIQVLLLKYIDCKTFLVVVSQCLKQKQKQPVMYPKFYNVSSDAVAIQDIAEYAVMLAVILVLVVGTIRLVGSNANNVFSSAASSLQ